LATIYSLLRAENTRYCGPIGQIFGRRLEMVKRLDILAEGFILYCQTGGLSEQTSKWYEKKLNEWLRWMRSHENAQELTDIRVDAIRRFVRHQQTRPCIRGEKVKRLAPATVKGYVSALRAFFSWAAKEGYLSEEENPMHLVKSPKIPRQIVPSLTYNEVTVLLGSWDTSRPIGFRNYAMTLLMLDTGIRAGELTALKVSDMDLRGGRVKVWGKGAKERFVPIGKRMRRVLWKYMNDMRPLLGQNYGELWEPSADGSLFLTRRGDSLAPIRLSRLIHDAGKKAGLKKCSPHILRHTFALNFVRNIHDPFSLQRILGHADLGMSRRYVTEVFDDIAEAHARASPVDRMKL